LAGINRLTKSRAPLRDLLGTVVDCQRMVAAGARSAGRGPR